jgi:hypothetical protein
MNRTEQQNRTECYTPPRAEAQSLAEREKKDKEEKKRTPPRHFENVPKEMTIQIR